MRLNRKNKTLVAGSVAVLYICYAFAFSNTLEYYNTYKSQQEAVENSIDGTNNIQSLVAREKILNTALAQYTIPANASFQNELLTELTELSSQNGLKIIDFREPHYNIQKGMAMHSYIFSLEGSFNGILLTINKLENNPALGMMKNIDFIKKRNYKTGTDYLIAEVILQRNETLKNKN